MANKQEWEAFFDAHAPHYDENPFAQHTVAEVDLLIELLGVTPGARLLDIGCGTGRHALELSSRGFLVTGIDLSQGMLDVARSKPGAESVAWFNADATTFDLGKTFDAAYCLCEGGFGLIGTHDDPYEHDAAILERAAAHLGPGAMFVLTCLNGYSVIRQMKDEMTAEGKFDPATMLSAYVDEWELPEGKRHIQIRERLFIAPEVIAMLRKCGFRCEHVYGGTAGHWGRRPLMLDEVEAMFVCRLEADRQSKAQAAKLPLP